MAKFVKSKEHHNREEDPNRKRLNAEESVLVNILIASEVRKLS